MRSGLHKSLKHLTGKQQQQICKLRLNRCLGAIVEAGAQLHMREGTVTQRGVRLAGTGREGPRWQCSAMADRQAGMRLNFAA